MFSGSSLRSLRAFGVLWQKFQLNELRCILSSPQTRTSSPLMIAAVNNEYFYLDNTTICHRRQSKHGVLRLLEISDLWTENWFFTRLFSLGVKTLPQLQNLQITSSDPDLYFFHPYSKLNSTLEIFVYVSIIHDQFPKILIAVDL